MRKQIIACLSILFILTSLSHTYAATDSIPNIVKNIIPATVLIIAYDSNSIPIGQGSGFFINAQGEIITNYHVMSDATSIIVKTSRGAFYRVKKVIASDEDKDLAKLLIDAKGVKFPYVKFANTLPQIGQKVIVIGSPLGLESTVSDGMVSGIRQVKEMGEVIQISAPISPGSSGGPVINMNGFVIGVATMSAKDGQNLNFAVPSKYISSLRGHKKAIGAEGIARRETPPKPEKKQFKDRWVKIPSTDSKQIYIDTQTMVGGRKKGDRFWIWVKYVLAPSDNDLRPIMDRLYEVRRLAQSGYYRDYEKYADMEPTRYSYHLMNMGFDDDEYSITDCVIYDDRGKEMYQGKHFNKFNQRITPDSTMERLQRSIENVIY
jgi:hypothetical protein